MLQLINCFRVAARSACYLVLAGYVGIAVAEVTILTTPDGGLQPRLVTDRSDTVHLLYFKKSSDKTDASEGNLFYSSWNQLRKEFGQPVQVSTVPFDLQASISRASLAVGGDGRVHAVWYLPEEGQYFHTRSNPQRTQFEPQRAMVRKFAEGIDAAADVAADGTRVAIVWGAGDLSRESTRTVYARFSSDHGASFDDEIQIGNPELGACACCSLASEYIDDDLLVAYRSAIDGSGRHMQLLTLKNVTGGTMNAADASYAEVQELQKWELSGCPVSTNDIVLTGAAESTVIFETRGRIVEWQYPDGQQQIIAETVTGTRQKNPSFAIDASGRRLVVWGEATSYAKGGALNMRLIDKDGSVREVKHNEIEMPDFSFPATAVLPDETFLVLY